MTRPLEIVSLDEPEEYRPLIVSLQQDGFVGLFGSAVSGWRPSPYPLGMALTGGLAKLLTRHVVHFPGTIERLIARAAFEHVMEACPVERRRVLRDNLVSLFDPTPKPEPNPIHEAIAALVAAGPLQHVVTTNYDTGIEDACRALVGSGAAMCAPVVAAPSGPVSLAKPLLFKIHGCAATDRNLPRSAEPTMVFHLGQEGLLEEWKHDLLAQIVSGQTLFVCGYSGLDFEICPEIERLGRSIRRIVWNTRDDPRQRPDVLTANAERVLRSADSVVLVGDMKAFFQLLYPPLAKRSCHWNADLPDPTSAVVRGLDDWDVKRWQLALFANIGCGTAGAQLARDMAERISTTGEWLESSREWHVERFWVRHGLGQALFHQGAYVKAALWYEAAEDIAARVAWPDGVFRAQMDTVEAERTAGRWLAAWRRLNRAVDREHHAVFLRKALVFKTCWQSIPAIVRRGLRRFGLFPKRWATLQLKEAASRALKVGARLDHQQAVMIASGLDIPVEAILDGAPRPLEPAKGYRHLGYLVAESVAVRDDLALLPSSSCKPDERLLSHLWIVDRLWELGAFPEMAKMVSAVHRVYGKEAISPLQHQRARVAWGRCEFRGLSRLRRLFHR